MGGWGSGPYGPMGTKKRKRTVEETVHIEINKFKNHLDGGSLTYSWGTDKKQQSISILTLSDHLVLVYYANKEKISSTIYIDSTSVGYGKRLWFNCPDCDNRTARLYLVGKYFKCRKCHNLTYLSCQESGDPLDYLALKIKRLQKRLALKSPGIYDVPYFKPKHMHYKTFMKLRNQLIELQEERDRGFLKMCANETLLKK